MNNNRLEIFENILHEKNADLTVIRIEQKYLEVKAVIIERTFIDFKVISINEEKMYLI